MIGPGKRDLGHWQAWAVTVVPRAGPAQFKSEARKAGGWEVLPILRPSGRLCSCLAFVFVFVFELFFSFFDFLF